MDESGDDGYYTQSSQLRRLVTGRTPPAADGSGQNIRILFPSSGSPSSSNYSTMMTPQGSAPQGQTAYQVGPQVIRIGPRYNQSIQPDDVSAMNRRGSVDSGLASARVFRIGPGLDRPRLVQYSTGNGGSDGFERNTISSAPRVVRVGPGASYEPQTSTQVFHIGPGELFSGRRRVQPATNISPLVTSADDDGNKYQYHVVRPRERVVPMTYYSTEDSSEGPWHLQHSESAVGSRRHVNMTPQFARQFSSTSTSTSQPGHVIRVQRVAEDGPLTSYSSEWHGSSTLPLHPEVMSRIAGLPYFRSVPASAMKEQISGNESASVLHSDGSDAQRRTTLTQAIHPHHLSETGRSNSDGTIVMETMAPDGRGPCRRVTVQIGGRSSDGSGSGGSSRRNSDAPSEGTNSPDAQGRGQPRLVERYKIVRFENPPSTSGSADQQERLRDFDRAIGDSIRQFMTQRQRQLATAAAVEPSPPSTPGSNPNAPWRTSGGQSRVANSQLERNVAAASCSPTIHERASTESPAETSNSDSGARNLFNKYKFNFGSFGNFSRAGSRDDESGNESGTGSGNYSRLQSRTGSGGPVAVFFFQDFDDMMARIRELRDRSQTPSQSLSRTDASLFNNNLPEKLCQGVSTSTTNERSSTNVSVSPEETSGLTSYNEDDEDSGYHTGRSSTIPRVVHQQPSHQPSTLTPGGVGTRAGCDMDRELLRKRIETFNNNPQGLIMSLEQNSESFDGFIRVHMNLIRPVQMLAASNTTSQQDAAQLASATATPGDGQVTTFHLPKDTSKVIHITSSTSTKEVIKSLLSKFLIRDNPRKFALYEKQEDGSNPVTMRRLGDDELPLPLCLGWTGAGLDGLLRSKFVLQENDTGEILWDAFSLPELESFLMILNKEEAEYLKEVKTTYRLLKIQMLRRLKELKRLLVCHDSKTDDTESSNP